MLNRAFGDAGRFVEKLIDEQFVAPLPRSSSASLSITNRIAETMRSITANFITTARDFEACHILALEK
jgi:hypothetical protein